MTLCWSYVCSGFAVCFISNFGVAATMEIQFNQFDHFRNCENNARLDGKVALITGATSGLGLEVAKNLSKRGAKLIIASRNPKKLDNARREIAQESRNEVIATTVDYESLASIRRLARFIIDTEPRLDILINNVGAIGLENKLTEDNLELMMQVNYFGTFLLTYLMFPLLRTSAPSRIVNLSSLALILGNIEIDHMNDLRRYNNFGIYCNAKLAAVLFTVEMNKRVHGSGVNVYSMDPGLIDTDFFRNVNTDILRKILSTGLHALGRPVKQIAKMPVFLVTDRRLNNISGEHYRDCAKYPSSWYVHDSLLTRGLWEESKRLVKINIEEDWEK